MGQALLDLQTTEVPPFAESLRLVVRRLPQSLAAEARERAGGGASMDGRKPLRPRRKGLAGSGCAGRRWVPAHAGVDRR